MKSCTLRLVGFILFATTLQACGPGAPSTSVGGKDIPYRKQLVMKQGDAQCFILPNGKSIAVWCERPPFPTVGEQRTASGLKTGWGEKPFVRPQIVWKAQADGSQVASGWDSYIEQGSVITHGSTQTSEYILYVGNWQFSIIEDLAAKPDLSVTIQVIERPR